MTVNRLTSFIVLFIILLSLYVIAPRSMAASLPAGFVYLEAIDPTILQEMRYAGYHNFIGRPIKGYNKDTCILTVEAAKALKNVQAELRAYGYTLKVYDCYRPQMAVDDFKAWSQLSHDQLMKREFYPRINKKNLFALEYIADLSGHTRGSTVDLTIVNRNQLTKESFKLGQPLVSCYAPYPKRFKDNSLDMGTGFDCLDKLSNLDTHKITDVAKNNRLYLQSMMVKHGFKPYPKEWWHFSLMHEPYPSTYFNFPIQ